VLSFFAQEQESRVLCYANANLTRRDQASEAMRFVEFWHAITGRDPAWLYFNSKVTRYAELSRLNQRGIWFITIQRLGSSVNFFHLDCLASEVRLNVDLDTTLTVLANGCYRWLAKQLRGFETAAPKQLFRKFVETSGTIEIERDRIVVCFDKRSHNPILREAALDQSNQRTCIYSCHFCSRIAMQLARGRAIRQYQSLISADPASRNRSICGVQAAKHSGLFTPGHEPQHTAGSIEDGIRQRHSTPALVDACHRDVFI
jgi:hypothetical protein